MHVQQVEFVGGQRAFFRDCRKPTGQVLVIPINLQFLLGHVDQEGFREPQRKLGFHDIFASTQHRRGYSVGQSFELPKALRSAPFVKFIVFAVEPEQRAKKFRIEKLYDRVDFFDAVFDWHSGQHERVPAFQFLARIGCVGLPVLDALCLVEDHDIGFHPIQHRAPVREKLLVAAHGEE